MIPSAEEFLRENFEGGAINPSILIKFAKLHVEKALKQASEKADTKMEKGVMDEYIVIDRDTILNAYSLNLIK